MRSAVVWYPGADVSVSDVAAGLQCGLEANGVQVVPYRLSAHLAAAGAALAHAHAQRLAADPAAPGPTLQDVYYHANMGVLERALRYDAEWVFMVSGLYQHPDYAIMLQRSGRRVALLCTESPYSTGPELKMLGHRDPVTGRRAYDHVFVNERAMVAEYRALHPSVSYLGAAWHPDVHRPHGDDAADVPAHDVVFVGTGFIERQRLLEALDWAGVDFGLYGTWGMVEDGSPLAPLLGPEREAFIANRLTAALYRRAKVGLNLHRTSVDFTADTRHVTGAESLNPRCYELAACGRFFVTDWRAELDDVFGADLPTFKTPAEAQALLTRALAEPAWREDVAARCAERVAGHSWEQRAAAVLQALDEAGTEAA